MIRIYAVAILIVILAPGCMERDRGPLEIRAVEYREDDSGATELAYTLANTGSVPANIREFTLSVTMKLSGAIYVTRAQVVAIPDSQIRPFPEPGDVIPPGGAVEYRARLLPWKNSTEPGSYFSPHVSVDYVAGDWAFRWSHRFPCGSSLGMVEEPHCGRYMHSHRRRA